MYYIGFNQSGEHLFKSEKIPTHTTHGKLYNAIWGPFRTKRDAVFALVHGNNNPHCITVSQAEHLAKQHICQQCEQAKRTK